MRTIDAGDAGTINLSDLIFSAKIDYLTIYTPGKCLLPRLDGKPRWARQENHRKLSLHDPSPGDVALLVQYLDNPRLAELEVAVDVSPDQELSKSVRESIVDALMVHLIAKGREPKVKDKDLEFRFRGVFEGTRSRYRLRPFNRVLPSPSGQQLHGKRGDHLQAKAYGKKIDQGQVLDGSQFVARAEVRMSGYGLQSHGLHRLQDLVGFRYRKELMPYFRHVKGVKRRGRAEALPGSLLAVLRNKQEQLWREEWQRVGVGAFLPGGCCQDRDTRFISDTDVNNRIGQGLLRLERRMEAKFVRKTVAGRKQ